ncbi:MAG: cytochrome C oxidase subunit IV family protein [Planctomycetota bacterium]
MGGAHADVSKHVKAYIGVFVALAVLTVVTVLASYIQVSMGLHITIALVIATIKASFVAAIFMHLKWERGASIWWSLCLCAIFFAVLMMLPSLTVYDHPPRVEDKMWDLPAVQKAPSEHH